MTPRRGRPRWQAGWWAAAAPCPSPNANERPPGERPTLVVLHSISLPPGRFGGPAVQQLFTNTLDCDTHPYYDGLRALRVSAHFLVRRDGRLVQFVSCDQRAWHAGVSRWRGRDACNDFSIGIEVEGLEGEVFAPCQYRALAQLLRAVIARYPIVDIVGHEHVAPGRKRDPGARFDWTRVRKRLRGAHIGVWPLVDGAR